MSEHKGIIYYFFSQSSLTTEKEKEESYLVHSLEVHLQSSETQIHHCSGRGSFLQNFKGEYSVSYPENGKKQNKTKHTHINNHTHKNRHFFIFVSWWKMYIRITFGDVVQTFLFLELLGDFDKYPNMSNSLPDNTLYVSKYCK